jgi:hypothetical protein
MTLAIPSQKTKQSLEQNIKKIKERERSMAKKQYCQRKSHSKNLKVFFKSNTLGCLEAIISSYISELQSHSKGNTVRDFLLHQTIYLVGSLPARIGMYSVNIYGRCYANFKNKKGT